MFVKFFCFVCESITRHTWNEQTDKWECVVCKEKEEDKK